MKASIITPTLDAIDWIDACVANVAKRGDAVLEHIVVDGGSQDGTLEKAIELARGHPRLTVLSEPGCNQSLALNHGSEAAAGEVIGSQCRRLLPAERGSPRCRDPWRHGCARLRSGRLPDR